MLDDLSKYHVPITELFRAPRSPREWDECRLTDEQVQFYEENGYLAGIRMLDAVQVERLRAELSELLNPKHPRSDLWYEFHSNESRDPSRVLFHALATLRNATRCRPY